MELDLWAATVSVSSPRGSELTEILEWVVAEGSVLTQRNPQILGVVLVNA